MSLAGLTATWNGPSFRLGGQAQGPGSGSGLGGDSGAQPVANGRPLICEQAVVQRVAASTVLAPHMAAQGSFVHQAKAVQSALGTRVQIVSAQGKPGEL